MSKFLQLVNENTPSTQDLLNDLEKEGVEITKTETGYKITFNLNVNDTSLSDTEENEEGGFGNNLATNRTSADYIDNTVSNIAANAGVKGYLYGTTANKAKTSVNKRTQLNDKMIAAYDKITNKIGQALATINSTP
jgi:flagellar hook-basal body complex protein FliE